MKNDSRLRKYVPSLLLLLLFEAVAVTLWFTKDNLFYLLNFSYIGGCMALGTALFTAGKRYARHFVQLAVGGYMLLYLGVISRENMQIEGFWYYLFLGTFEAATIHYACPSMMTGIGRTKTFIFCASACVMPLLLSVTMAVFMRLLLMCERVLSDPYFMILRAVRVQQLFLYAFLRPA